MKAPTLAPPRAYLFGIGTLALLIVGFAIYIKGDVKAGFKMLGIELTIETKDRATSNEETATAPGKRRMPAIDAPSDHEIPSLMDDQQK